MLTDKMKQAIDREAAKFPENQRQSASLMAIRIVQDQGQGWVSEAQLDAIADYLGMPRVAIYEIATFYTMCKREPQAKYTFELCTNVPCMLAGSEKTLKYLMQRLGVKDLHEITPDGKFAVAEAECLGACTKAPVCQIGKQYYEHLTEERIDQIIRELEAAHAK